MKGCPSRVLETKKSRNRFLVSNNKKKGDSPLRQEDGVWHPILLFWGPIQDIPGITSTG